MNENKEHNPDISFTVGKIQTKVTVLEKLREQDRVDIDKLCGAVLDPEKGLIVKFNSLQSDIKRAWKIIAIAATIIGPVVTAIILRYIDLFLK